jgi:hypothetical protein
VKRLFAILFSLLLVWAQAFASTTPVVVSGDSAACGCIECGAMCCCVTPSTPDSQPAPAAPVRAGTQNELSICSPTLVAWTLPACEAHVLSSVSSLPSTAMGVPLFTRHCALLI